MNASERREITPAEWRRIRALAEAALDLAAPERAELLARECADEPAIEREVLRLLELDGAADARAPARVGPYTLRRRLGSGGMGSVWLAVQSGGDFHRRVAVKLLHEGQRSDELLARFQRERQVLANLDHPGIARLIDGGVAEDGRPYLVMEYVEGQRIDRWCDEQGLSVRARLELFRKVCDAVQHAHQRLVVHRDLKPSNVFVTADGNPKLLDFGIAKVLDPEKQAYAEVTQGVVRFFTPAYASPEQVKGLPVTTASDVYSLGVLLYQLLTGRLPQRGDTASPSAAALAASDGVERPSDAVRAPSDGARGPRTTSARALARALAGDLDRIVLKALRPEPLRRYATVHELSEDVRRHLAGLPVSARPDSALYRASRFVRRNRAAVGLAALLVASLCTGLVVAVKLYRAADLARADEREQRELAQARLADLARLSEELGARNTELERARELADSRFQDIRRFTTTLLFDVHSRVYRLEGATEASGALLEMGVEYLDRLAGESASDPSLARELAAAYLQLADQQAGLYHANVGALASAEQSLEKAARVAATLAPGGAPEPRDRATFSQLEIRRGDLDARRFRAAQALERYERAVALSASAEHDSDAPARDRYVLSTAISRVGQWMHEAGRLDEAEREYARATRLLEEMLERDPGQASYANDLAIAYGRLGAVLADRGEREPAIVLVSQSLDRASELAETHPQSYPYARQRIVALFQLAILLEANGETEEARGLFGDATREALEALERDPTNSLAQRDVVLTHAQAAGVETRAGEWQRALPLCETALPVAKQRSERDPADWLPAMELAQLHVELGRIKSSLGMQLEAGGELARAAAILERMGEPAASEIAFCRYYAQTAHSLGSIVRVDAARAESAEAAERSRALAREWLGRAERVLARMVDSGNALPVNVSDLARVREELALCDAPAADR